MIFRVPLLLNIVDAVILRLDTEGTRATAPPTSAKGYSDVFREPIVYDEEAGASIEGRKSTRTEMAAVRVPCQVETGQFDELRQSFAGDLPRSEMALVFHRKDLLPLGLIDPTSGNVTIKKGDRIEKLEKHNVPGVIALRLPSKEGLFVNQVLPASWGFGPDGYDLHIAFLSQRDEGTI